MDYSSIIVQLYNSVFQRQKNEFYVNSNDIREAIGDMKEAYMPNRNWRHDFESKKADYDNAAHRCAYLHKYAMLHTGLVCEILQIAFNDALLHADINSKRTLNLCSLGGGPGSDIVALLLVLRGNFGFVQCTVNVIDIFLGWKHVFDQIVLELRTGRYGVVKDMVSSWYFSYDYMRADMLANSPFNFYKVYKAVTNADILTMVKFVSAAACAKTRQMLKEIFNAMKPGAILLFVDNAAGGFHEILQSAAYECGMMSVFGPFKHYEYEQPLFSRKLYGYTSQSKTKVVIEIWKKPVSVYNTTQQLRHEFINKGRSSDWHSSSQRIRIDRSVRAESGASEESGCCSII